MKVKGIIAEDFINYKKPSLYIAFPKCDFKCDRENGNQCCQNWSLAKQPDIEVSYQTIINYYLDDPITKAIVFAGLEPLESWEDVINLISEFRKATDDPIIIYTGFTEAEVADKVEQLKQFDNLIMKFGRFRPGQTAHTDELLGVRLANDEQYAKKIS